MMTRADIIYVLSRGDENLQVVRGWTGQDFFVVVGRVKLPCKRTGRYEGQMMCTRVQSW